MKKLLIVVDYQNDFVDGALGFPKAKEIENNIVNKINEYKNNNDEVIYTLDTHYENYMTTKEGENLPIPHCIKGTFGHEIHGKVKELSNGHLLIEKETFGSRDLMKYLEKTGERIVYSKGLPQFFISDIMDELADLSDEDKADLKIKVFKKPSKNYSGKYFLTATVV